MAFLPDDFQVPPGFETEQFVVRPITIHDVVMDYDAVMTNRDYLWSLFGDCWSWPRENMSLEQDMIDLAWHQKEAQLCRSFNFAVMAADEDRLLGCVYIDPPENEAYDAEVQFWVRQDDVEPELEDDLLAAVKDWLAEEWPFEKVALPGREISWEEYAPAAEEEEEEEHVTVDE